MATLCASIGLNDNFPPCTGCQRSAVKWLVSRRAGEARERERGREGERERERERTHTHTHTLKNESDQSNAVSSKQQRFPHPLQRKHLHGSIKATLLQQPGRTHDKLLKLGFGTDIKSKIKTCIFHVGGFRSVWVWCLYCHGLPLRAELLSVSRKTIHPEPAARESR